MSLSRYMNEPLYKDDGVKYYEKRKLVNFSFEGASIHIFKQSDTLDNLAYDYYNEPTLWWILAEANKDIIMDVKNIPIGSQLVIPSKIAVMEVLNE